MQSREKSPDHYSKRWIYVVLGILINLCLGTIYSWSVFRRPIEEVLDLTATQSGLPYMFFLFFYAVTMPLAGKYIDKYSPRWIAAAGGIMVSAGWFFAGLAGNIYTLTLTYGIIGGMGVGVVYGVPISVAGRWYPDQKGTVMGLTLLGFGLSPFLTAPAARSLIENVGVMMTFRYLGLAFLFIIILLSLPLKNPRLARAARGDQDIKNRSGAKTWVDILKSVRFFSLWFCYLIGTFAGLMAIGITSPVGEEMINLPGETAALTLSLFAVFNGVGRPLYGWITDRFSPHRAAILSYILILIASILMLGAEEGSIILFIISFSLLWLNLGGWLAIAPAATGSIFGSDNYSRNYGLVFTAYGVGALLGTAVSGSIRDLMGSYINSFYVLIILSLLGIAAAWLFLKERSIE